MRHFRLLVLFVLLAWAPYTSAVGGGGVGRRILGFFGKDQGSTSRDETQRLTDDVDSIADSPVTPSLSRQRGGRRSSQELQLNYHDNRLAEMPILPPTGHRRSSGPWSAHEDRQALVAHADRPADSSAGPSRTPRGRRRRTSTQQASVPEANLAGSYAQMPSAPETSEVRIDHHAWEVKHPPLPSRTPTPTQKTYIKYAKRMNKYEKQAISGNQARNALEIMTALSHWRDADVERNRAYTEMIQNGQPGFDWTGDTVPALLKAENMLKYVNTKLTEVQEGRHAADWQDVWTEINSLPEVASGLMQGFEEHIGSLKDVARKGPVPDDLKSSGALKNAIERYEQALDAIKSLRVDVHQRRESLFRSS